MNDKGLPKYPSSSEFSKGEKGVFATASKKWGNDIKDYFDKRNISDNDFHEFVTLSNVFTTVEEEGEDSPSIT